jgi:hypothetical protein
VPANSIVTHKRAYINRELQWNTFKECVRRVFAIESADIL